MLEMFFDNKRVFSVFEQILKSDSERVNVFKICFKLGLDPRDSAEIVKDFVFLGILEETNELEEGVFRFNAESPITLGICLFDDFIGRCMMNRLFNKGDDDNSIHLNDEDFIEFLKENGLKL